MSESGKGRNVPWWDAGIDSRFDMREATDEDMLALYTSVRKVLKVFSMNYGYCERQTDTGPNPYVLDVEQMAAQNQNFRTAIWTGNGLQMTLMSIPPCGEIGLEVHPATDQYIRVECGAVS